MVATVCGYVGCTAVATLNTQRMYGADYWHHQMIFGVSSKGVFVTNGIEVLSFGEILTGLESPSVLAWLAERWAPLLESLWELLLPSSAPLGGLPKLPVRESMWSGSRVP